MQNKYQEQYSLHFTNPSDRQLISSYLADCMGLITSNQEMKAMVSSIIEFRKENKHRIPRV